MESKWKAHSTVQGTFTRMYYVKLILCARKNTKECKLFSSEILSITLNAHFYLQSCVLALWSCNLLHFACIPTGAYLFVLKILLLTKQPVRYAFTIKWIAAFIYHRIFEEKCANYKGTVEDINEPLHFAL